MVGTAMCSPDTTERPTSGRYARDILALQERLNFRSLHDVGSVGTYAARRADGLVTLGLRTDQLSSRHLLGLQGFRLAQYLQLGWVCPDRIAAQGMFCEPTVGMRDDDLHMVTVDRSGQILGYLGLVGAGDGGQRPLDDPDRELFPVEVAHGINLFDTVPTVRNVTADQVRELKRFVHRRSMTDRLLRLRVSLELLLAAGTIVADEPNVRLVTGDVEEHVALRHLVLIGLQVQLIDGTTPQLNTEHYLHLAYVKRGPVRPFVAEVPSSAELRARMDRLQGILSADDVGSAARTLLGRPGGSVERIAA